MGSKVCKFYKILKELRLQNGWSRQYIAEKLGVTYQAYQAYELGVAVPSLERLVSLADLFDVSLDELVGRDKY